MAENKSKEAVYADAGSQCMIDHSSRFTFGFFNEEQGWEILRLHSGGGFLDWGIVIGPEEMPVSESEFVDFGENRGEYRLKMADGAYVWYEFQ